MTFEEAFDKAVKAFYEGKGYDEFEKATGAKVKYNKSYFDEMEPNYKKKKEVKSDG
jgi:hypothetical protein